MAVPKRFAVVRFFGVFMKIVAWIVLIISILGAIGAVLLNSANLMTQLAGSAPFLTGMMSYGAGASVGIIGAIILIIGGIVNFLVLYFIGEMVHMGLAVEENTRLTAALLLRMHQESRVQEEQAAYGESGFAADTYE